jgi:hypothetical protein
LLVVIVSNVLLKQNNNSNHHNKQVEFTNRFSRLSIEYLDIICIQDVKSKQMQETLVHAQEALVIQILLDVLHQYKKVGLFVINNMMY